MTGPGHHRLFGVGRPAARVEPQVDRFEGRPLNNKLPRETSIERLGTSA